MDVMLRSIVILSEAKNPRIPLVPQHSTPLVKIF